MLSDLNLCALDAAARPAAALVAADASLAVISSLDVLAPRMCEALMATLVDCRAHGLAVPRVYETRRTDALQRFYYARGRPPSDEYPRPVTNAADARHGWHFFGCAADVLHPTLEWKAPPAYYLAVATIAESHGLKSGTHWRAADLPHLQWGGCSTSPHDAPGIYDAAAARAQAAGADPAAADQAGLEAVWRAVGAMMPTA